MPPSHCRAFAARFVPLVSFLLVGGGAYADSVVTILHPAVPAPTIIDQGAPGESVGDLRLWHFAAETDDGDDVRVDWIMTTTGIDAPSPGIDSRVSTGIFSIDAEPGSQLLLQGVAHYPGSGSTLAVSSSAVRIISGGSGRFAGARGWVESVHLDDGTWKHVLHLE